MQPGPDPSPTDATASAWGADGDPALLVEAAHRVRLGIETGVYHSHSPGEHVMFGLARLLEAIAMDMRSEGAVHGAVVTGATEIAHLVVDIPAPEW